MNDQQPKVTSTKAPWEELDPTAPRVRLNLTQNANGAWRRDQTIEWPSVDPLTPEDAATMHDQLNALDRMVREHVQELYDRDQVERDEYFRSREQQQGYGNQQARAPYRRAS